MENVIKVNENLILHYKDGFLSKVKKPLDKIEIHIYANGSKYWYKNGKPHRDNNLPAIEWVNGEKHWFENGQFIRSEKD